MGGEYKKKFMQARKVLKKRATGTFQENITISMLVNGLHLLHAREHFQKNSYVAGNLKKIANMNKIPLPYQFSNGPSLIHLLSIETMA